MNTANKTKAINTTPPEAIVKKSREHIKYAQIQIDSLESALLYFTPKYRNIFRSKKKRHYYGLALQAIKTLQVSLGKEIDEIKNKHGWL
jgi:hypothetical protein